MKVGDVIGFESSLGMKRFGVVTEVSENLIRVLWDSWGEYQAYLEDKNVRFTDHDREMLSSHESWIQPDRERSILVRGEWKTSRVGVVPPEYHSRIKWANEDLRKRFMKS